MPGCQRWRRQRRRYTSQKGGSFATNGAGEVIGGEEVATAVTGLGSFSGEGGEVRQVGAVKGLAVLRIKGFLVDAELLAIRGGGGADVLHEAAVAVDTDPVAFAA